jgi:8-oxo-dGTP pyrophosphatase MutT (NUDIX family)
VNSTVTSKITKTSVTNFIYCGDEFLFLKRNPDAAINAGELNGIGGKLDPFEDFLSAAIRETKEETGYMIKESDIQFCGIINFEEGYKDKWITCFFKIQVPDKEIPLGNTIREGELLWLHKNNVLNSQYKLVDDLNYIFKAVIAGNELFFMSVEVDQKSGKIIKDSTKKLAL